MSVDRPIVDVNPTYDPIKRKYSFTVSEYVFTELVKGLKLLDSRRDASMKYSDRSQPTKPIKPHCASIRINDPKVTVPSPLPKLSLLVLPLPIQ